MEERLPVSPPPQQSPTTGTTHSRPSTMLSATAPDPTTPLHPPPSPLTSVQSPGQLQVNRTAVSANTKLSDEKPDSLDEKLDSSLLSTAWEKYKEFEAFRYRYIKAELDSSEKELSWQQCFGSIFIESGSGSSQKSQSRSGSKLFLTTI